MEDIHLKVISWNQFHSEVFELAGKIRMSGYQPDMIVGIGFGGIIPATTLYFALPETKFRILYPSRYGGVELEHFKDMEDKKILLVDDLAITGDSLNDVKNRIVESGAQNVLTACLYCSENYEGLDYYIRRLLSEELVVFPWYTSNDDNGLKIFKYHGRFGKHEPKE